MITNDHNDLLTVSEAAARLGVSVVTVRRWLKSGRLRAVRIGPRRVCIPRSDVEAPRLERGHAPARGRLGNINLSPLTDAEVAATLRFLEEAREISQRLSPQEGEPPLPPSWVLINEERDRRTEQLMP
ncbi:MAG: helix-turn-helix domain-containing protein [Dehalococcoidia bacterium]|nr:helix-turn-helix domain-containing protein [Dehalococcoidia bacterium]